MTTSTSSNFSTDSDEERPLHPLLPELLVRTAARHHHLCPRQVLGVRLGLRGLLALGLICPETTPPFNNDDKRLLTIVETDGCGADGIAVATHCFVGRRTLRVADYGKVAATLIDTHTGQAVRVAPTAVSRQIAQLFAPEEPDRWRQYLLGYQRIPDEQLVTVQAVTLQQPLAAILSQPNKRAVCQQCHEEIMNEREVVDANGRILCQTCAGHSYYQLLHTD
ncbi:MAG: formylmethanofuran dehydrogenase [Ardenticatenaceae bacterium]|nr:formylmethanofuran dehydrogenase [Ardenticatenaceae bacterium]